MGEEDVGDYGRARWNDLVRTSIALGSSRPEAEELARLALARCWPGWKRLRRTDDVDVHVYATLLQARARLHEDEEPPLDAATRVLETGAGLADYQIDRILGLATVVTTAPRGADLDSPDWEDLYRGIAPIDTIAADVRRSRRRRILGVVAALVALGIVGTLSTVLTRDDTPAPDPKPVVNPIGLAWWTDGVLHLGRTTVPAPGLRSLAQAGAGTSYSAVYGDSAGDVVQVDADGTATVIGRLAIGAPVVGSPAAQVAWVDPLGRRDLLVVWDTRTSAIVRTVALPDALEAQPLAVDGDDVYLHSTRGTLVSRPGAAAAQPFPGDVLDVANGSAAVRAGHDPVLFSTTPAVSVPAGESAKLSVDGSRAVAWTPHRPGATVQASSNPARLALPLPAGEVVLDADFAPDGSLVLVTARVYNLSIGNPALNDSATGKSPLVDLVTCDVDTGDCTVSSARGDFAGPDAASPIVLAH